MNQNHSNICKCGHDETNHKGLRSFEDGTPPPSFKQTDCKADNCKCDQYIFDKKVCSSCGKDLKMTQYARGVRPDGSTPKATDCMVCRNYPACGKAEKE